MIRKWLTLALVVALALTLVPTLAGAEQPAVQLHMLYGANGFTLPAEENPIRDAIREATGIDIRMEAWYYSSDEEMNTQLNLWAASGDLPFDFFMGGGSTFAYSMWNMMGESGLLYDLEPYVKSSEAMTQFVAFTFPKYRDHNDGKVYMYPYHLNTVEQFGSLRDAGLSMRIDWMKELGLAEPTSPDEYYALLTKIKEKYNVIPFSTSEGNLAKLAINFVGQYGTGFWEKDADGVYRIAMFNRYDKLTDFAVFCNKMWNEGLMDQESFTQKAEQLTEKLTGGQVASTSALRHSTQATINDILWAKDENALLAYLPSFPVAGVTAANTAVSPWGGAVFVANSKAGEEKMQALVRYWDWLLTKEGTIMTFMGVEGVNWAYNADGKCAFLPDFVSKYPTENERQEYGLWHYQSPAASWFRIDQYAAPKPEYSRADYSYSMAHCNDTIGLDDLTYAITAGEEEQLRLPSIDEAWEQAIVKAVMAASEADCRAVLEGFKSTLDSLGYEAICKERTELTAKMAG